MTDDTMGRVAYRAYGNSTGNLNYQGLPMPTWEELGEPIQQAWIAAADMVQRVTMNPMTEAASASRANYGEVWTELTGWVQAAQEDGEQIDPAQLLTYLRELKQRALAPMRDWMRSVSGGEPS